MNLRTIARTRTFTIILHLLVWTGLFLIPFTEEDRRHVSDYFLFRNAFLVLMLAAFYYINYYGLIPKLLLSNKLPLYYLCAVILLLVICLMNLFFANLMDVAFDHMTNRPVFWKRLSFPVFPVLFVLAISTAIRLTSEWFRSEKMKKEMENEKLTSELAFLKSQVNPHFLFNILNNICSLARKKSDNTENAIIKLAEIMRYMLDDSRDEKVIFEKEIDYLRNYIELQQMRISGAVDIDFRITGNTAGKMIAPLLLIPFVENAFKHGVSYLEKSEILIDLEIREKDFILKVKNNKGRQAQNTEGESGVGLRNVIRRLELLYPGKHSLKIDESDDRYMVELIIEL